MAVVEEGDEASSLVFAPTWAVASVCFVFIVCSLLVERIIHGIGHFWKSRKQMALFEALEKVKEELMVVGFISLALSVGESNVTKICVPEEWTNKMRQCKLPKELIKRENAAASPVPGESCADKGKADYISLTSLHQLHIFLFALAMVHVVYSVITVGLGMWKVRRWKAWEAIAIDVEVTSAHGEPRYTKDSTFIKRHAVGIWSRNYFLSHIAAFFQQLFQSVSSTDYLTLRHGFISTHNLQNFNFHTYIMRSMEKDFQHVVGISAPLWGYMVLLLLVNVEGWGVLYWAALLPFLVVLAVGTKLRYIITRMAVRCLEKNAVIEGLPAVKPSDDLFWFHKPKLILSLIHLILFQNSLEVAVHLWSKLTFEKPNCFNKSHYLLAIRLILGFISQVLCGYVVLPVYALVSQMGSQMQKLEEMELCTAKVHEGGDFPSQGSTLAAANSITPLQAGVFGISGGMEGARGEGTIVEVDDNVDGGRCAQRKMSMVERVARGVQGEAYYELKPRGT